MAERDRNKVEGASGRQRTQLALRFSSALLNGSRSSVSGCEVVAMV